MVRAQAKGVLLVAFFMLFAAAFGAWGEAITYFRIGTGGTGGTYYPIGRLLARSLNGTVPGLVAVAELSSGSVANVQGIRAGTLEAGLVQADVASWAYAGGDIFADQAPIKNLRALANLYPESIHIVARKDSGIHAAGDLRGRRVSLDEPGSGTIVEARFVLSAYGLAEKDLMPEYIKPSAAIEKMAAGGLDAFFFVGGYPASSIATYAERAGVTLVPIDGRAADELTRRYRFLMKGRFPAGTYGIPTDVSTLEVGAQLLVAAELPEELVYQAARRLWQAETLTALAEGHPKGKLIRPETALSGIAIPLHPGAERYYRSVGLLQ